MCFSSSLTSGCCYKILENPAAMRDKELKDSISNLLGLIVKTYHQSLGELNYVWFCLALCTYKFKKY